MPSTIKDNFDKKIAIFMENPHDPKLKTHKLEGKLQSCLSFYLRDGYRVLFEFSASDTVNMLNVGPHSIYQKKLI